MSTKKTQRKTLESKAIPVRFSASQRKTLTAASAKTGLTQADLIRVGAWMLSQMAADTIIEQRLRWLRAGAKA